MRYSELCLCERFQALDALVLVVTVLDQARERDARTDEKVLKVTLGRDESCRRDLEDADLRSIPGAVVVGSKRHPGGKPSGVPTVEALNALIAGGVGVAATSFKSLRLRIRGQK